MSFFVPIPKPFRDPAVWSSDLRLAAWLLVAGEEPPSEAFMGLGKLNGSCAAD
jgi:hypothetical protein